MFLINKTKEILCFLQFTIKKLFKFISILFADPNQAQTLLSSLKQLIEKLNNDISQLNKKCVKLETVNEMLVNRNVEIMCKDEMIKENLRLKGIK